ncbi:MAG: hypothetical protein ACE5KM_25040, partial [Planctomycetaceae bacterium]
TGAGGGQGQGGGGVQLNQQVTQQAAQAVGQALFSSGSKEPVTRGGLDLSAGAKFTVNSIYDLIDVEVEVNQDGTRSVIASPWTTSNMASELPNILEQLTTTNKPFIDGRVNVNQARQEVLEGVIASVEGFDEDENLAAQLAKTIVDAKMIDTSGAPLTSTIVSPANSLFVEGYLTTRGDVFRAQVVGFFDKGGPVSRVEVLIDATQRPPRVIFQRDLTNLGRGFTAQQLGVTAE